MKTSLMATVRLGAALLLLTGTVAATAVPAGSEIDDGDLTRAVETCLLFEEDVASHLVDVSTNEGVVVLSGSVDDLLAKDRAVAAARSITGVRAVVDNLTVSPVERIDSAVRNDVMTALLVHPVTESFEIDVTVKTGDVTLTGKVDSWTEKHFAGIFAKGVKGVRSVTNDIMVIFSKQRPDAEISEDVRAVLDLDPLLYAGLVNVAVKDGRVTLSGVVGSAAQKRMAFEDAWVTGVTAVGDSTLQVEWWARDGIRRRSRLVLKSDAELHDAVMDAMTYDPRVLSFRLNADVEEGTVTLTGTVDNLNAKLAAAENARNTPGVTDVINLIRVRWEGPGDLAVLHNVSQALERSAVLERYDIAPTVRNGRVFLYGTVDTWFDRTYATTVVSQVRGVARVDNFLDVRPREWPWKSDGKIRRDIENALEWTWDIDAAKLDVTVKRGVAAISGRLDTWNELKTVVRKALASGADTVECDVKINGIPFEVERTVPF